MNLYIKKGTISEIILILFNSIVLGFALIVSDYFDYFDKIKENNFYLLAFVFLIVLILINFVKTGLLSTSKFKFYSLIDRFSLIIIFSIIINIVLILSGFDLLLNNKLWVYLTVVLLFVVFLAMRIIYIIKNTYKMNSNKIDNVNVNDLNVLFSNNFSKGDIENKIIILEEKEVKYDLLGREELKIELYNYLVNSKFNRKLTIALTGKWGIGKSSIFWRAIEDIDRTKYIIIDDFDPWKYETKDALLLGFFNSLMKNENIQFDYSKLKIEYQKIKKTVMGVSSENSFLNYIKSDTSMMNFNIEDTIVNYLKTEDKKIIFLIDNLDRANTENVKFVFNLINNVFNFPNIIYILLYDNKIINSLMNSVSDKKFIDKLIDYELSIPDLTMYHKNNILLTVLKNIYEKYNEKQDILEIIEEDLLEDIAKNIEDIRDLKKYFNYIIPRVTFMNARLNINDLVRLYIIKKSNIELYYEIKNNPQNYIKYFPNYSENYRREFNFNKTEDNLKGEYRKDKFGDNGKYKEFHEVIDKLFPLGSSSDQELNESIKNNRIFHGKYFDAYFTNFDAGYIGINSMIKNLVLDLNSCNSKVASKKNILDTFSKIGKIDTAIAIETLAVYIDDMKTESLININSYLYNNMRKFDDSFIPFSINTKERAIIFISDSSLKIPNEKNTIFENMEKNIRDIDIFSRIMYWIGRDSYRLNDEEKNRVEKIKNKYIELIDRVLNIKNSINLYSDEFYSKGNIWALYREKKDKDLNIVKDYVLNILSEENIIRFLADLMSLSSSGIGYTYSFKKENIECLISEEKIDTILSKIKRTKFTDDEKFVLLVYKKYKDNEEGNFKNAEFTITEQRDLKEL